MIFHTKLLEVNVNAGKLGLGLGQLSMKKPYSISIIPPYYTQLVDLTPQLSVSLWQNPSNVNSVVKFEPNRTEPNRTEPMGSVGST